MAKWLVATGNIRYADDQDRQGTPEIITIEADDFKIETVNPGAGAYPIHNAYFLNEDGENVAFLKSFTSIHKEKSNV